MKGLFICLVVYAALHCALSNRLVVVSEKKSPATQEEINETPDNHHPVLDNKEEVVKVEDAPGPEDVQNPVEEEVIEVNPMPAEEVEIKEEPKTVVEGDTGVAETIAEDNAETNVPKDGVEEKQGAGGETEKGHEAVIEDPADEGDINIVEEENLEVVVPEEAVVDIGDTGVEENEPKIPEDKAESNEDENEAQDKGQGNKPENPVDDKNVPEDPDRKLPPIPGIIVPDTAVEPNTTDDDISSPEVSDESDGSGDSSEDSSEENLHVFEEYEVGCLRYMIQCPNCGKGESELSIESRPSTIHEPHGADITLPCTVTGPGYNNWRNQIIWHKIMSDGEELQINTGGVLSDPWARTGRYTIIPGMTQENKIELPLTIKGLKLADNGTYRCDLRDNQDVLGTVSHTLIVPSPIADLTFKTNMTEDVTSDTENGTSSKTIYDFEELKPAHVSCKTLGGNPMPIVKIFRGKTDITGDFTHRVTETRLADSDISQGSRGLAITNYAVEVFSHQFLPTADHNGEKLRCVAKVPHTPDYKRVVAGEMNVRYPPKFECQKMQYVSPYTQEYVLNCTIHSNPPVEKDEIYWVIGDPTTNVTNLTIGETKDGFSANASVNGDKSIHLVLTIDIVNLTDFQTYNIRAKNGFGEHHFQIHLNEATTTTTTTTPKPTKKRPSYEVNKPNASTDNNSSARAMPHSAITLLLALGLQKMGLFNFCIRL